MHMPSSVYKDDIQFGKADGVDELVEKRYLAEAQYRFNHRFDLKSILTQLVPTAALTAPRAMPRIRLAEECR